jgi:hypothetical protein
MRHHMSGGPQVTDPQAQVMGGALLGDMRHHMSGGSTVTDPRAQMLGGQILTGPTPEPSQLIMMMMNRRLRGFGGM